MGGVEAHSTSKCHQIRFHCVDLFAAALYDFAILLEHHYRSTLIHTWDLQSRGCEFDFRSAHSCVTTFSERETYLIISYLPYVIMPPPPYGADMKPDGCHLSVRLSVAILTLTREHAENWREGCPGHDDP